VKKFLRVNGCPRDPVSRETVTLVKNPSKYTEERLFFCHFPSPTTPV
jgi:hypothetical protein